MSEESKTALEQFNSFLSDDNDEGNNVGFITPNIELKLSAQKRKECREILLEIRKFGVSQRQILYLIYLLSLELEDNVTMKSLVTAIGQNRENIKPESLDVSNKDSGIIIEPESL